MSITDNMRVLPQHQGITNLMCPGSLHDSAGRQDMYASHCTQTRVPANGELPHIFTGFESLVADYSFNSAVRKNTIKVIAIVNKYEPKLGSIRVGSNPMRTVIYRDMTTGEISYFDLRKYTHFTNEFGYENHMKTNIQVGDVIKADTEIYSSSAKDGGLYKIGVNANVAFMTTLDTTEDSLVMSESLAAKLAPTSIEMKTIAIDVRKYPLNLYGNEEYYKIIPDIGDCVNPDGILCAFRPVRKYNAISDLMPHKLFTVNHLFDDKIFAHPGAKVIDIEVYINNKSDMTPRIYDQLMIYNEARVAYWQEIVSVYEKHKNIPISGKFNSLVTRAMGRLLFAGRSVSGIGKMPKISMMDKFSNIKLKIDITLAHKVVVNKGFKSTGRDGAKGVVVVIKPDDEMPIDEQGFKADICIDPVAVLKRTNIIQLYEQYFNRVLKWQAMHLDSLGPIENQFARIIEVLNDINPEYAKIVANTKNTKDKIERYVDDCKNDTIKLCCPPGMDKLNTETIFLLNQKYSTPISPVEFTIMTSSGKKRIKTKDPVCIGAKYIYLLSKYPKPLAPGFGYVNQYHLPIGLKDKNATPIGTTPIRFGEAESRMFTTAVGPEAIIRLRCLYGNSKIGPNAMLDAIMSTDTPSKIDRVNISTEELYDDNHAIRIAEHMLNTCGIQMQNSIISDEEAESIYTRLNNL
jgi:hypothetical protein